MGNTRLTQIKLLRGMPQGGPAAMQAQQADSTPRGGDTIEKSTLKRVKEILPEKVTIAIFCALTEESVAVRYSLDEKFECRYKTIGPRKYIYSFGRIGDHNIVIALPKWDPYRPLYARQPSTNNFQTSDLL